MNIPFFNRISSKDKAFIARQLSTMLSSGLPISESLRVLRDQSGSAYLKSVFDDTVKLIEEGHSLSNAISHHPKVFNRVFVAVVRSGESSGKLEAVLEQLATQLESDTNFIGKIKGAMLYPVFILLAMIAVVLLMGVKVIPQLKGIFLEAGSDLPLSLPLSTKMMISLSDFSVKYWWAVLLALVAAVIGGKFWLNSPAGKIFWDRLQLKIPGGIIKSIYMARFTRTTGMLIEAGLPIIETIDIVADVMDNEVYSQSLQEISAQVKRGAPMSRPLANDQNFPPIVSQVVNVGEQTGELDKILKKLAEFYETDINSKIAGLSSLIEPVVMVVLGIGVAFIVFSILIPIYNISQAVQ